MLCVGPDLASPQAGESPERPSPKRSPYSGKTTVCDGLRDVRALFRAAVRLYTTKLFLGVREAFVAHRISALCYVYIMWWAFL